MQPGELAARAKELFFDALDLPASEREAFVAARCGADGELATRVRSLLAAHAALEGGMAEEFAPGDRLGPFRLEARLGQGGYGEVWRAQQDEPVRRSVAIKVLRPGLDSRDLVARFENERQALALMQHPCVARVFEFGATPRGRPWLAMELVEGPAITEYCAARDLSLEERMRLAAEVARAVQHAHQRGVLHRDLKPSNVLVSEHEGRPVPKVIDFGIAKALGDPLIEGALATRTGAVVGTPAYMSPEQLDGSPDVDTRADVYALGVLAYELAARELPWPAGGATPGGLVAQRAARDRAPARPSERLARSGHPDAARRARGELDWVALRALEPDRERRYASAGELADDLERFARGEGVLAGPPSAARRVARFVRRHRAAVAVGACAVLALSATAVVASVQAVRALRAEREARVELARFEEITRLLESLLAGVDPAIAQGRDPGVLLDVLDRYAAALDPAGEHDPAVEASLRRVVGLAYLSLGLLDRAEPHLARALELREGARGPEHEETLGSLEEWGAFLLRRGRAEEAEPFLRRAYDGRRAVLGESHADTTEARAILAIALTRSGRPAEAEPELRAVLTERERELGPTHVATVRALNNLAEAVSNLGRSEEARELWLRALDLQTAARGEDHPDTLAALHNVASWELEHGDAAAAEPLMRRALDAKRRVLPAEHPSLLVSFNNLAQTLSQLGRDGEAEELFDEALVSLGDAGTSPEALALAFNRASLLMRSGRAAEAEPALAEIARAARAAAGERAPFAIKADGVRADVLLRLGRPAEAEPLARAAAADADLVLPPSDLGRGVFRLRHAAALCALDRADEARAELERARDFFRDLGDATWLARAEEELAKLDAEDP